ncbi:MAG: exonuclease domain-containing protein [Aeromicrobium sp.]
MASNKFRDQCTGCQSWVEVDAGSVVGPHGGWQTYCPNCQPAPPDRGDHDGWHMTPLASLDFETTGVDPCQDRVVSYGLLGDKGGELVGLVNPGMPIPPRSSEVHGISDAQVADAQSAAAGIAVVVDWVQSVIDRGAGLVVFNAPYDLTMLRAEAERWGVHQPDWDRLYVVDPYVIDWGIERGRLGKRKLTNVCDYYGVSIDNAHDATCDARAAREVAVEMGARHSDIGAGSLAILAQRQREWYAMRAEDWNEYAIRVDRSLNDPHGWPLSRTGGS